MCKSWKVNGFRTERLDGERYSDHKRREFAHTDTDDSAMHDHSRLHCYLCGEDYTIECTGAMHWCKTDASQ